MKTKLLYVLVSSESDIYLEQAYISMMSARHQMPDVKITLVTDNQTDKTLVGNRKKILDLINEKIIKDLPFGLSGQKRSRILKTSCRNLVNGDFLFIDCDTIVLKPLDEIDFYPHELAACRDSHAFFTNNPYRKMCIDHCRSLGCNIENENEYFNSGVILARDTKIVHSFYEEWNKNWEFGVTKHVFMDQPSFARTNLEFNHLITKLDDVWNCQIIHGVKYIQDAKILHYLCTSPTKNGDSQIFILRDKSRFFEIKKTMNISPDIYKCFDNPFEGIEECVHILAGNNVKFCQSEIFIYFERNFGDISYYIWNKIFRGFNLLHKLRQRIPIKLSTK